MKILKIDRIFTRKHSGDVDDLSEISGQNMIEIHKKKWTHHGKTLHFSLRLDQVWFL